MTTIEHGDVYLMKNDPDLKFVLFGNCSNDSMSRIWLLSGNESNSVPKESWERDKVEENWEHIGNITELLTLYGKALETNLDKD